MANLKFLCHLLGVSLALVLNLLLELADFVLEFVFFLHEIDASSPLKLMRFNVEDPSASSYSDRGITDCGVPADAKHIEFMTCLQ